MKQTINLTYKLVRRIVIFVVGISVVLLGVVMFVTPGPAIVVIPAGLAILSLEFAWARRWLKVMKDKTRDMTDKAGLWQAKRKSSKQQQNEVQEDGSTSGDKRA